MIQVGSQVLVWPIQRAGFLMDPGTGRRGVVTDVGPHYVHVDIGLRLFDGVEGATDRGPPLDCKRLPGDILEIAQ